jgi:SAM-dependent methyltransferase
MSALEISGSHWANAGFASFRSVEYPNFDICSQRLPDTFDMIIAEQVFEHLLWPYRAGRNVFAMLRPGGYFLITTPFLYRVHEFPVDCSRWTELGLKYFLAECGFQLECIRAASWGNRQCVKAFLRDYIMYRPLVHSLKNEPGFPIVVWAIAQRSRNVDSEVEE